MKFNESQQRTLPAAVNRIIPADDYPSAWQAGVGDYLAPIRGWVLDAVERASDSRKWKSV